MSWLLPAFVPGLLMAATFALDRLETGLNHGRGDTVVPGCLRHRCPAADSLVQPPRHGNSV